MKLSLHKKILIFCIVLTILFALGYCSAFQYIKNANEQTSLGEQKLTLALTHEKDARSTEELVVASNPDIARINNSVVASDGDITLIELVETLARNDQLQIIIDSLSLEDDPMLTPNGTTFLKIKAKTKGNWSGTRTFLSQLESLPYQVKIDHTDMLMSGDVSIVKATSTKSSSWDGLFEFRVLKQK